MVFKKTSRVNPIPNSTDAEYLVQCASDLCAQIESRWRAPKSEVDLQSLGDIVYWRFCRFASYAAGRFIEMHADSNSLHEFLLVLEKFIDVTDDIQNEWRTKSSANEEHMEKIRRANVHCKERRSWLEKRIHDYETSKRADQLISKKLAAY